jgi:hypothetical protein
LKAAVKSRLKEGFAEWEAPVSAFILIGQPQAADKALNGRGGGIRTCGLKYPNFRAICPTPRQRHAPFSST